jgi:hypothetical protein
MPQYLSLPSGSARMAVGYITTGILMIVWTGVWMHFLYNNAEKSSQGYWYVASGLMLSGFALLAIGILMGRIGQEAKNADGVAAMPTAAEAVATFPQQVAQPAMAAPVAAPVQQMPVGVAPQQVVGR